jgi:hypothetical protein
MDLQERNVMENNESARPETAEQPKKDLIMTIPGKILVLLGGLFTASLPWVFIKTIPGAANFYLLQPLPLMFVTYPAIYITTGVVSQLFKIKLIWTLLICQASFALVISLMIAPEAIMYFVFYAVFMLIGNWAAGYTRSKRLR